MKTTRMLPSFVADFFDRNEPWYRSFGGVIVASMKSPASVNDQGMRLLVLPGLLLHGRNLSHSGQAEDSTQNIIR